MASEGRFLTADWRNLVTLNYRADRSSEAPSSAFVADGSRVSVCRGQRLG